MKHQRPINTDFILFEQIIRRHLTDIPDKCVDKFLVFIDCHPQMRALTTIVKQLGPVLPIIERLTKDTDLHDQIPHWRSICDLLIQQADLFLEDFPEIHQPSKNLKRAPFPKQFEQYPLYTTLWYDYPEETHQSRYRLLHALLLISQHEFRRFEELKDKHYDSITLGSTRLVRQFAELKSPGKVAELRPLLLDLPDSVESIKAYLDFVLSLEEGSQYSQEPFDEAINILRRMLEYVVSNKGGYTRKTSRTAYSGPTLPPNPGESCHPFHGKAATDSGEGCHPLMESF